MIRALGIAMWLAAALVAALSGELRAQERRVALVIGNGAYEAVRALPNPASDARAIAASLRAIGFDSVREATDLRLDDLRRAVVEFGRLASGADVALVYFAGHGIEIGGRNLLIPVDARLDYEQDAELETVPLDVLLNQIRAARRFRLVILDACRDNPFAARIKASGPTTRSIARGLARVEPAGATFVAYAAKEGTVARDGEGANSPYTATLLRHIAEPGLPLERLFGRVRDGVLAATGNQQEPFLYGSFGAEPLYLVPPRAPAADANASPAASAAATPGPSLETLELAAWNAISASRDRADFEEFLRQFPQGRFAGFARNRLRAMSAPPTATPAPVPAPAKSQTAVPPAIQTPAPSAAPPSPPRERPAGTAPPAAADGARWPLRSVELVVPFPPGGLTDMIARLLAAELARQVAQPVVVANRPGVGGAVGLQSVGHSTADGHVLAIGTAASVTMSPALHAWQPAPAEILIAAAPIGTTPMLIVSGAAGARSFTDLMEKARNWVSIGTLGNGSSGHFALALLQSAARVQATHVPYVGSAALSAAALSGEIDAAVMELPVARLMLGSGQLRALATTGARRSSALPTVPTIAEAGVPGYEAQAWIGVFVPARTPRGVVARINTEIARALQAPDLRSGLAQRDVEPAAPSSAEDFATQVRQDAAKWTRVARSTGMSGN